MSVPFAPVTTREVVARHEAAGRAFEAAGVRSFVLEEGSGPAVVCMHGVPSSSFLYRKLLPELAQRGMRGVAFDFPGLGLAERPESYDYTWSGLGRFASAAVDTLELDTFHLVVHDIGGPVGFELAATWPERVRSITLLNTLIEVDGFKRPWMMEPFARRGLGEAYIKTMTGPAFRALFAYAGARGVPKEEVYAYVHLLKRVDGGQAFLKVMRGFERTAAKQELYLRTLRDHRYPVQAVWGAQDPTLKMSVQGDEAKRITRAENFHPIAGKHFIPEDQAPAIAEHVARIADARLPDTADHDTSGFRDA